MPTYSQDAPTRHDSSLIIGDTWRVDFALEDVDGTAFDLTGVSGTSKIRVEPSHTVIASPTVTVTSAATGEFSVALAAASTASLTPGEYLWAVRLTWGTGEVHTVAEGRLVARHSLVG